MSIELKAIQLPVESLRKFQLLGEQFQESVRPQFQAISDMVCSVQEGWSRLGPAVPSNPIVPCLQGIAEKREAIDRLCEERGSTEANVLRAIIARPGISGRDLARETGYSEPTVRQAIQRKLKGLGVYNSRGGYRLPWWLTFIIKSSHLSAVLSQPLVLRQPVG